jgi:hypothetical protein
MLEKKASDRSGTTRLTSLARARECRQPESRERVQTKKTHETSDRLQTTRLTRIND